MVARGSHSSNFSTFPQIAIPVLLLIGLALTLWLTAFVSAPDRDDQSAPYLRSRGEGQIDGITAARRAVEEARSAVDSTQPEHDGLLAGPLEQVRVRYESLGTASSWTVLLEGPIRSRPNTPGEFTILEGMIVVEISAFTGEISGHFAEAGLLEVQTAPLPAAFSGNSASQVQDSWKCQCSSYTSKVHPDSTTS